MAARVILSVATGFIVYIIDFGLYYLSSPVHMIVSMLIVPFVMGVCFYIWRRTSLPMAIFYSVVALLTLHLIGLFRVTLAFYRTGPLMYVIGTLKALAYVLPFEILAAVLGCIVVILVRRARQSC